MISILYMLYSRLSLNAVNEHLGETDTYSWSLPFSVTPFSWLCMLHKAPMCCSKRKLERLHIEQGALRGSVSNFNKSLDTSAAV